MRTVLSFITGLSPGGAENMMAKTIKHLNKDKYRIIVCSLVGGALEEELRKDFPVFILNAKTPFHLLPAIFKLRKIIKKERADIIHSYLFHANIISRIAAIKTGAKVISSIRIKEIAKPSHNIIDSLTKRLVDKYTTVSESVRQFVIKKEHINPNKVITIPNGLDFNRMKPKASASEKRKELGLSKEDAIILSVAHLRKTKDYPTLFNAMTPLRQTNTHLLVVGKGEAETEYKKIAQQLELDNVHFLGQRKDVFDLLNIADVCVLSTFYEGQSNALLEYMAAKKPIIATDIEENREVMDNGKEGILVPPQSPNELARAILTLLTNQKLPQKLANNAYARVKRNHDIKRVAKQTEELYESLCAA